jgi:hypothetical protein
MRTLIVTASLLAAGTASAQPFDDFEGGVNLGGWVFGGPNEFIAPAGGNPQ